MPSQDGRISGFKNHGKDSASMRRHRGEVSVELRKQKREDQLQKRRNLGDANSEVDLTSLQEQISPMTIEDIWEKINSSRPQIQLQAVQAARKMLSKERSPPINILIEAGIIPQLVVFLSWHEHPELQFEAAWALTNIASGTSEQTKAVVDAGAIPPFVELLSSPYMNVCEQAVWALGNIVGDGPFLRDLVLQQGVLIPLLHLATSVSDAFLRNVTWALSNLCRNKNPSPPFNVIKQCLPVLAQLVSNKDKEVVQDACWALSYLTDGTDDKIQEVIETGIVPRLAELLGCAQAAIVTPALRAIGNIVTGSEAQTQVVVDSGVLTHFHRLLVHPKLNIQKEAAWAISNITAGSAAQIQAVIDFQLLDPVRELLDKGDSRCQKEAAWAVTNLTSGGTTGQIATLVTSGFIPPMVNLLSSLEPKTVVIVLEGLWKILKTASKLNREDHICVLIEECGGLDKLEHLQEHQNEKIYTLAYKIIDKFFSDDEEESTVDSNVQEAFTFVQTPHANESFNF